MHRSNPQRDSWHKYGTCGAGEKFLSNIPLVNNLWEQHIRKFYKGKYIASTHENLYLYVTIYVI